VIDGAIGSGSVAAIDLGRYVPGKQLVYAADRVHGDALEYILQVRFAVKAVQLRAIEQPVESRGTITTAVGAGEETVPPKGNRRDLTFERIVVDLEASVADVAREFRPAFAYVADRRGKRRLAREGAPSTIESFTPRVDEWAGASLSSRLSLGDRLPARPPSSQRSHPQ